MKQVLLFVHPMQVNVPDNLPEYLEKLYLQEHYLNSNGLLKYAAHCNVKDGVKLTVKTKQVRLTESILKRVERMEKILEHAPDPGIPQYDSAGNITHYENKHLN